MVTERCDEVQPEAEPDEEVSAHRERVEVTRALKDAAEQSNRGQFESAQHVIVSTQEKIKSKKQSRMSPALLLELEDAHSRMASRSSWEQGGRAETMDAAQMHMMQRCTNVSKSKKSAVSKVSKEMYCSPSAQMSICKASQ